MVHVLKDTAHVHEFILGVEITLILYFLINVCLHGFFRGKKYFGV